MSDEELVSSSADADSEVVIASSDDKLSVDVTSAETGSDVIGSEVVILSSDEESSVDVVSVESGSDIVDSRASVIDDDSVGRRIEDSVSSRTEDVVRVVVGCTLLQHSDVEAIVLNVQDMSDWVCEHTGHVGHAVVLVVVVLRVSEA
jgi:hypothetical protein